MDEGAANALMDGGKSLLPSGVVNVDGEFGVGAPVELLSQTGGVLGKGLVNYRAADIRRIAGLKTSLIKTRLGHKPYDEIIHRDNLVMTRNGS